MSKGKSLLRLFVAFFTCLPLAGISQLIPARGRQVKKATNRRRRLFPLDICFDSLPGLPYFMMHDPCQPGSNLAGFLDYADRTRLSAFVAMKKFCCQESLFFL